MRFQVTYTRTLTLTQIIEAGSEEEANWLATDEVNFLKDIDFEAVSTKHEIELCPDKDEVYNGE